MIPLLDAWRDVPHPVIGMVHLLPLPGSPGSHGNLDEVRGRAIEDAESLVAGGVQGLLLENYGDVPFFLEQVPPAVVACMAAIATELRRRFDVPLGINVLRNDASSALAIALASGAQFIRVNVLHGARWTDQGLVTGPAARLLRERKTLGVEQVRILADVNVKHSSPVAPRPLEEEVHDLLERGGADGLIVSGTRTGAAVDVEELRAVRWAAPRTPIFIGSGVSLATLDALLGQADGLIVGTSFKHNSDVREKVDRSRVQELVERVRSGVSEGRTS